MLALETTRRPERARRASRCPHAHDGPRSSVAVTRQGATTPQEALRLLPACCPTAPPAWNQKDEPVCSSTARRSRRSTNGYGSFLAPILPVEHHSVPSISGSRATGTRLTPWYFTGNRSQLAETGHRTPNATHRDRCAARHHRDDQGFSRARRGRIRTMVASSGRPVTRPQ